MLTDLGAQQLFRVGSDYRARYLASNSSSRIQGISEFKYDPDQVYASAPDQSILLNTATAFLQGLYPPLDNFKSQVAPEQLANGSTITTPLTGYQYVTLHGINNDSPETIWIKGDDNCPAVAAASADFKTSAEYQSHLSSTRDFYHSLYPLVSDIYPSASALSYASAYDIFDVINVARIHNKSSPASSISDADLFQLRTLADSAEFGLNFNASQPTRSLHASTFAGSVLAHLNQTVAGSGSSPKFTLLAGSYDVFLAFFGLANLTSLSDNFYGLPDYASTMAFEIFSHEDVLKAEDAHVRFLFRNGTEGTLTAFPLFGLGKEELSWGEFVKEMDSRGVSSVEGWCDACGSDVGFCKVYGDGVTGVSAASGGDGSVDRGSWIAVVVVMAVALAGNAIWAAMWVMRSRRGRAEKQRVAMMPGKETESVRSVESV